MTLVVFKELWCDHEGCDAETEFEADAVTLRKHARQLGWRRVGGKDYCPEHAPSNASPTASQEVGGDRP